MRCRVNEALEENPTNALASKAVCGSGSGVGRVDARDNECAEFV